MWCVGGGRGGCRVCKYSWLLYVLVIYCGMLLLANTRLHHFLSQLLRYNAAKQTRIESAWKYYRKVLGMMETTGQAPQAGYVVQW